MDSVPRHYTFMTLETTETNVIVLVVLAAPHTSESPVHSNARVSWFAKGVSSRKLAVGDGGCGKPKSELIGTSKK